MFGGRNSLKKNPLIGFEAGGISAQPAGDKSITVTSSPARQNLVGQIAATFPTQAAALAKLRAQVTPGFGRLTTSQVKTVQNARRVAIGTLQENLARRRVLGSSFGQDAITRANLEFSQEEEKVRAASFLSELDLSQQLLAQEFSARRGEASTLLDELNIQTDIGTQLASQATSEAGANARANAQLQAQALEGVGSLVGVLLGGFL